MEKIGTKIHFQSRGNGGSGSPADRCAPVRTASPSTAIPMARNTRCRAIPTAQSRKIARLKHAAPVTKASACSSCR